MPLVLSHLLTHHLRLQPLNLMAGFYPRSLTRRRLSHGTVLCPFTLRSAQGWGNSVSSFGRVLVDDGAWETAGEWLGGSQHILQYQSHGAPCLSGPEERGRHRLAASCNVPEMKKQEPYLIITIQMFAYDGLHTPFWDINEVLLECQEDVLWSHWTLQCMSLLKQDFPQWKMWVFQREERMNKVLYVLVTGLISL